MNASRGAVSLAAVVTTILLLGCGSALRTIDAQKVERAITQASFDQRSVSAAVACPSGVPRREGLTFYCVAQSAGRTTTFRVTETSSDGAVSFLGVSPDSAPRLDTDQVALAIRQTVAAKRHEAVKVRCPAPIPRQVGLQFGCVAQATSGVRTDFLVSQTPSGVRYAAR